jgi:hypothetical protein
MCLLLHEPSWKFARLLLIGLVASYCSRRIYQDLQAPVRPVRHACRFLRNRERNEQYSISETCYAVLKQPLPVKMAQAMRAVLFASAIAAMLTWRRCITDLIHWL